MDLLVQVVLASAVVLGLAYASLRLLNGAMSGRMTGRNLKVIEAVAVGRRAQVVLVEARGKQLLLGVTDTSVALLREVEGEDGNVPIADPPPAGNFADWLPRFGRRDDSGDSR